MNGPCAQKRGLNARPKTNEPAPIEMMKRQPDFARRKGVCPKEKKEKREDE